MKIKYLIDKLLSTDIKALPFVDRYSGVVRTLEIKINSFEGQNGETKKYPISCDVTQKDCDNISIFENLIPNDSKKSIVYWEELSPMANVGVTKQNNFFNKRFEGIARVVVWLNLAKLGQDCTNYMEGYLELEKVITQKGKILGGVFDGCIYSIEPIKDVAQDRDLIFGKYTYKKEVNYYLYPYDFFAIDVKFSLEQCLSKGATIPSNAPLDCENDG